VDVEDYYRGRWANTVRDADKACHLAYAACATAPNLCPIHESTADLIAARVNSLFERLKQSPLIVPAANNGSRYGVVDYGMAKTVLINALYAPYSYIPRTFSALAAAEKGQGTPLFELFLTMSGALAPSEWRCTCDDDGNTPRAAVDTTALAAIGCGDALPVQEDIEDLEAFYEELAQTSSFADVSKAHVLCACVRSLVLQVHLPNLQLTEVGRLKLLNRSVVSLFRMICVASMLTLVSIGPFAANTSHPILLIGNTAGTYLPGCALPISRCYRSSYSAPGVRQ